MELLLELLGTSDWLLLELELDMPSLELLSLLALLGEL
jgi:hypothetical protein